MSTLTASINTDNNEIIFFDSETGCETRKWCVEYLEKNSHLIYRLISDDFFASVSKLLPIKSIDDVDYFMSSSYVEMSPLKDEINNNIIFWYIIRLVIKNNPGIKIKFSGACGDFWSKILILFITNNSEISLTSYLANYFQRFKELAKGIGFIFRHIIYSLKYTGVTKKISRSDYDVLVLTPLTGLSTDEPLDSRYWNSNILKNIGEDLSSKILVIGPANGITRENLQKIGSKIDYFLLDGVFNWRDLFSVFTLVKRLLSIGVDRSESSIFNKICLQRITQSICGAEVISNAIITRQTRRLFSNLVSKNTKVIGLFENQGYEKIVYKHARLNGQKTYGYCHTVVRMFDFRYSLSAALESVMGSLYVPEFLLVNGRISLDAFSAINLMTPISSKVIKIPAFRFEGLKTVQKVDSSNLRKSGFFRERKVGVVLGITPMDRILIRRMYGDIAKSKEIYGQCSFYVRPHPSLGLNRAETPGWIFDQGNSISEFVSDLDLCLISPTTASIYDVLICSKVPVAILATGGALPIDVELFGDERFGVSVYRSQADIERLVDAVRPHVEYGMVFY